LLSGGGGGGTPRQAYKAKDVKNIDKSKSDFCFINEFPLDIFELPENRSAS
jgi:hypothetical protein